MPAPVKGNAVAVYLYRLVQIGRQGAGLGGRVPDAYGITISTSFIIADKFCALLGLDEDYMGSR